MKFALKVILSLVVVILAFSAGMSYESFVRTEKIMGKWQEFYSWTDEEGQTFFDLVGEIELSPEEAARFVDNIARFNESTQIMMENDHAMMVATCYQILRLLEEERVEDARTLCLERLAFYYNLPNEGLPEMIKEGSDALKRRIEALAEEVPDLQERIVGEQ